jgi:glycosyltransferase 2 family protein
LSSVEPLLPGKLKGRLLLGLAFGAAVYLGLCLWADGPKVLEALANFPASWVAVAMALSFSNYLVRFVRWERYRAILGIEMSHRLSLRIYLAGLALTVTPGKMGEAFRSILIRAEDGTPISRSAPMVVAERFTDLLGFLLLLALGGLASHPEQLWIFLGTLALCVVLAGLLASQRVSRGVLGIVARLPLLRRFGPHLENALRSSRELLTPRELPLATVLATIGWGLEACAFFLVCEALVPGAASLSFAVYTFALSSIVGAVLVIFPGGLGVTEASMSGLLTGRFKAAGLAPSLAATQALTATLVIRLATLWFAVAVGLGALGLHSLARRKAAR